MKFNKTEIQMELGLVFELVFASTQIDFFFPGYVYKIYLIKIVHYEQFLHLWNLMEIDSFQIPSLMFIFVIHYSEAMSLIYSESITSSHNEHFHFIKLAFTCLKEIQKLSHKMNCVPMTK